MPLSAPQSEQPPRRLPSPSHHLLLQQGRPTVPSLSGALSFVGRIHSRNIQFLALRLPETNPKRLKRGVALSGPISSGQGDW